MKNAQFAGDYAYVIDILEYAMNENIRPSTKFYEILSSFKHSCDISLKNNPNEDEQITFDGFFTVYKKWKKQMGLKGLKKVEALELLNVHPWKQLKEAEGDGIENLKNERTRRYWKKQHTLKILSPNRLNHLQSEKLENIEKIVEIDGK